MHTDATKQAALAQMQRRATLCLVLAGAVFGLTALLPPHLWVRWLKAGAEAAMVGGLADWFAVVALFRRPLGLPIPHTAIVPSNKDRIADNLAEFVKLKFLKPDQLVELIQRSDPARLMGQWLLLPGNAQALGRQAMALLRGWLALVDDERIRALMAEALRKALGKVDLSKTLGATLDMLSRDNRPQQLLDALLDQLIALLQRPELRQSISTKVVSWLRSEHGWAQKLLPTEWLGERAAQISADIVERFLREVAESPSHELRDALNTGLHRLVENLKQDEAFVRKGHELLAQLQQHPALLDYSAQIWARLRGWLSDELGREDATLPTHFEHLGLWLGRKLEADPALRDTLNALAQRITLYSAPHMADFVAGHIQKTMRQWDAEQMTQQVELSIGRDLQYIRISGTVVGGCIGLLLFAISHPGEIARAVRGLW